MKPVQLRDALANIAESQEGVREVGGNNRGPMVVEYQEATWLKPDAWPWCAAFICWIILRWLELTAVREALGMALGEVAKWRPRTAGASDFERWAREHGMQVLPETAACRRGDLVTFDFSHIGIVTMDSESGPIHTIEGNTEPKGGRDGGGVYAMVRQRSTVRKFIRVVA